jgi:4'-phosphopantetheinyl transferase EntD
VIADILPPGVASAESIGPEPDHSPALFPAEDALVRTAGPRRRAEFAAGRACARAALARLGLPGLGLPELGLPGLGLPGLGLPAAEILAGRAGEPRWPAGVTGSITHCAGYRACAVARTTDLAALGIDAEPDAALPAGLIESVAGRAERAWIARQARIARQASSAPAVCWDRLLFSAKEAVGKLCYPLTGQWPGTAEITVFPDPAGGFEAQVAGPGPAPARLTGRWLARGGLIVTAVTWPAAAG